MQLARDIGEIKDNLNLEIVDEKAEHELKSYILNCSRDLDLDPEFSGRVVNLLISEAVRIQRYQRDTGQSTFNKTDTNKEKSKWDSAEVSTNRSSSIKSPYQLDIKSHMDVFNAAKYLESQGQEIIHMEVGEPDFLPPVEVRIGLEQVYGEHKIHYTQSEGILSLRNALSEYISKISGNQENSKSISINPSNVIVTPGGRFGIFAIFSTILRSGDEIIVIEPAWPACVDCANYMGVKSRFVRTDLQHNWEPDIKEIENQVNTNTKIICLNYPNNPTGKILSKKSLESIAQLAIKRNVYLLSDEVYSNYKFKDFFSVVNFDYERSILLNSFSKTFAMTGFRVGYLHSLDNALINKLKKFQALTLTSVPEPMQFCALKALKSNTEENCKIIKERIDLVCNSLKGLPFDFAAPDGAMYIYAKIQQSLNTNDLKLVGTLLKNGVAVAPGSGFGANYSDFIRISTCIDESKIKIGMEKIANCINLL
jgi:aspartate aminotransferase